MIYPHMSNEDRAAQFVPFAALSGQKEAVKETARITEERKILDDDQKEILNRKLQYIMVNIHDRPFVKVTYFEKDLTKKGGSYLIYEGHVKKIEEFKKYIVFVENIQINIYDIFNIEIVE